MSEKIISVVAVVSHKEIMEKIINNSLTNKLAVVCQVSKINSSYWWHNTLEYAEECKIELITTKDKFNKLSELIEDCNDYSCTQITFTVIDGCNKKYNDYILGKFKEPKWLDDPEL